MGSLDDFQRFGRRLERELDRLDAYADADRPYVKQFVRRLDGRVAESTLAEYLKNLRKTAERLDQPLVDLDEIAFDEHVYELRHADAYGRGDEPGFSDGTVRNIQFAVRKFCSEIDVDGTDWADDYELIKPADNSIHPSDMLRPEDIAALREGANNLRDIALIEFLADTGARLSLVGSLRVGDVDLDGPRATYTPNPAASGLKGADIQPYPIIDAKAVLRTYLNQTHPRPDREDVALFHLMAGHGNDIGPDDDGAITPGTIRKQLRKAADNGGVDRPVNPHNFRHSAVTRMVREGFKRSQIEHRVHWDVDTDMWQVYEHISGEEHNEDIFRQAGVVDDDDAEGPVAERQPCGNCREPLAAHHEFCPRCGEPATPSARHLQQEAVGSVADGMAAAEDLSEREFRAWVIQQLQADPRPLDGGHDAPPSSSASDSSNRS